MRWLSPAMSLGLPARVTYGPFSPVQQPEDRLNNFVTNSLSFLKDPISVVLARGYHTYIGLKRERMNEEMKSCGVQCMGCNN